MFTVRPFEARTISWWYHERDNIDMNPVYQRRSGLWTEPDRSFLIDSIINEFDIPKIYIADFTYVNTPLNKSKKQYAVIDGKQRLGAIFDFFDGKLLLDQKMKYFKDISLVLGGLSYRDLKSRYSKVASTYDNFNLSVMSVITDEEEKINDLFIRLNRSQPLTGAELRNAMNGIVPALIRDIASHKVFKAKIRFKISRGQDLNEAAKLLLLEYMADFVETKRPQLDQIVTEGMRGDTEPFEVAAQRVVTVLNDMDDIFIDQDPLLRSQAPLALYYWFVRNTEEDSKKNIREFLVKFNRDREINRRISEQDQNNEAVDDELLQFDIMSRSANNQGSLVGRYRILTRRFEQFLHDLDR
jgi:Protein of unknown function DUF262